MFWFSSCFLLPAYTWWASCFSSWVLNSVGFACDRPSFAAVSCDSDTGKSFEGVWLSPLSWAQDALVSFAPFIRFCGMRTVCVPWLSAAIWASALTCSQSFIVPVLLWYQDIPESFPFAVGCCGRWSFISRCLRKLHAIPWQCMFFLIFLLATTCISLK